MAYYYSQRASSGLSGARYESFLTVCAEKKPEPFNQSQNNQGQSPKKPIIETNILIMNN